MVCNRLQKEECSSLNKNNLSSKGIKKEKFVSLETLVQSWEHLNQRFRRDLDEVEAESKLHKVHVRPDFSLEEESNKEKSIKNIQVEVKNCGKGSGVDQGSWCGCRAGRLMNSWY